MILLSLGVPRVGKTQALMDYVRAHARTHRFFVVDRAGDWTWPSSDYYTGADRWRGMRFREFTAPRVGTWAEAFAFARSMRDESLPWFADAPSPDDLGSWAHDLPRTGVFRFGHPWEGIEVAELVREVGNTSYVDDELDLTAEVAGWPDNPLRDFCHRGRHLPNAEGEVGEVHLLGASRRAQAVHIDVVSLADHVWIFRVQGHRTVQRLVDEGMLAESEVAEARSLPPYHYKSWQASGPASWGRLAPLGAASDRSA